MIVDIAVAENERIVEKENEKVKKFQELKQNIPRMWNTINCAGDKDCCRIIRKSDEELWELAGKLDIIIIISLPPKNYATKRKGRILRKVLEV